MPVRVRTASRTRDWVLRLLFIVLVAMLLVVIVTGLRESGDDAEARGGVQATVVSAVQVATSHGPAGQSAASRT
jgi:hypothetical protein